MSETSVDDCASAAGVRGFITEFGVAGLVFAHAISSTDSARQTNCSVLTDVRVKSKRNLQWTIESIMLIG